MSAPTQKLGGVQDREWITRCSLLWCIFNFTEFPEVKAWLDFDLFKKNIWVNWIWFQEMPKFQKFFQEFKRKSNVPPWGIVRYQNFKLAILRVFWLFTWWTWWKMPNSIEDDYKRGIMFVFTNCGWYICKKNHQVLKSCMSE